MSEVKKMDEGKDKTHRLTRRRAITQWALLALVPIVIIGGQFFPKLGFIVPVVMVTGLVGGFFGGRWVCGHLCPRGGFLERILAKISLNRGVPVFFRHYTFRWVLFGLLMGFMVYRISLNPGEADHWGRVFIQMCLITTSIGIVLGVVFHPRTWCAACPVGTFSSTVGGHKNPLLIGEGCRGCRVCEKACPLGLEIAKDAPEGRLLSPDCMQCRECIKVCPRKILSFAGDERKTE